MDKNGKGVFPAFFHSHTKSSSDTHEVSRMEDDINKKLEEFENTLTDEEKSQASNPSVSESEVKEESSQEDDMEDPEDFSNFKPKVNTTSPEKIKEQFGVRAEKGKLDGKTVKVLKYEFTKPLNLVKNEDTGEKRFWTARLKIFFDLDNYSESYPTVRYFYRDGVLDQSPNIYREGNDKVAQLLRLIACDLGNKKEKDFKIVKKAVNDRLVNVVDGDAEKVKEFKKFFDKYSDQELLDYLVGKEVLIKETIGKNQDNKEWYRNDIEKIVG